MHCRLAHDLGNTAPPSHPTREAMARVNMHARARQRAGARAAGQVY